MSRKHPEARPHDHTDEVRRLAKRLAEIAADLATMTGTSYNWFDRHPEYRKLTHHLEDAHAAVEAATIEARRRVRINEGRGRKGKEDQGARRTS